MITDIEQQAGVATLDTLWLADGDVRDIAPLAGLPALRLFGCDHCLAIDIEPLANVPTLESVTLIGTPIATIDPLANLPREPRVVRRRDDLRGHSRPL